MNAADTIRTAIAVVLIIAAMRYVLTRFGGPLAPLAAHL